MQPEQTLTTERLRLRAPEPADAPRMAELANDYDVARMLVPMPYPYTVADAADFIEHQADFHGDGRAFAIEHPDEGLIGVVGVSTGKDAFPMTGYWLGRPYWGRGYATEALEAAMGWTRSRLGARAIMSSHFVDNPASGWVLTKAGFLYTGEVRPLHSAGRGEPVMARKMIWLA